MNAPQQPTTETRKELIDIAADREELLTLSNGKRIKTRYLRPDVQDKLDEIIVDYECAKKKLGVLVENAEKDEALMSKGNKLTRQFYAKSVAAILLNGHYFRLRLFWWLKWRWLYYFGKMTMEDYLLLITDAKKKAQQQESYLAMVSLMDMTTTWTMMTRKEAEAYRQELELVREHQSLKNSQH